MKKPKRHKDTNQLAKNIVDLATGKVQEVDLDKNKNLVNVEMGQEGDLIGGSARAKKLTKEQRSEIARKAALKRWKKIKYLFHLYLL